MRTSASTRVAKIVSGQVVVGGSHGGPNYARCPVLADAHSDLLMELVFFREEERPFATRWLPSSRPAASSCRSARSSRGRPPARVGAAQGAARGRRVRSRRRREPGRDRRPLGGRPRRGARARPARADALARGHGAARLRPRPDRRLLLARRAHGVADLEPPQPVRRRRRRGAGGRPQPHRPRARRSHGRAADRVRSRARQRGHVRRGARAHRRSPGARQPRALPRARATSRATSATTSCARSPSATASSG